MGALLASSTENVGYSNWLLSQILFSSLQPIHDHHILHQRKITMSSQRLHDRVAVVTGSSQGIGREICNQFYLEGALLVCADLRPIGQGEEIATHEWIVQKGGKAIFVETDVSKAESWKALVAKTVETYGKLDM
jgi:hypothetical protein